MSLLWFELRSSAGLAVGDSAAVMGFTPWVLCLQINCVLYALDYYLLNSQLWIQDWVGLCFGNLCISWVLLRVWLPQTINFIDYVNFQPKSSTFSKKLAQKYQKLWTSDFILHILKAMTALYCVPQCTSIQCIFVSLPLYRAFIINYPEIVNCCNFLFVSYLCGRLWARIVL